VADRDLQHPAAVRRRLKRRRGQAAPGFWSSARDRRAGAGVGIYYETSEP
jgi:hypothetical protein